MTKSTIYVLLSFMMLLSGKEPNSYGTALEKTPKNDVSEPGPPKTEQHKVQAMQYFPQVEMFNDVEVPSCLEEAIHLKVKTRIDEAAETAHFTWEPVEDAHYYVLWQLDGKSECLNVILWVGDDYSYKTDELDGSRFLVTAHADQGKEGIEDDTLVAYGYTQLLKPSSESTDPSKQYPSIKPCEKYTIMVDKEAMRWGCMKGVKAVSTIGL